MFSLTTPRRLTVQSDTKTRIFNNTMLLRCWRGTCNFEASLHRAPTNRPLFDFPEETHRLLGPGGMGEGTRTRRYSTRSSSTKFDILTPHRDVEPDATHRIPLLLRVFNHPPPIKSLIHGPAHVSHHLRARCSLHVAPRLKNSATRDPVRYSCRLSQHSNAGVRKEVPLGEMRTPYEILYTKDGTVYIICAKHYAIQIDDESPATSHWFPHNKSC